MKQAGACSIGVGTQAIAQTVPTVDVIVTSLNLVLPGSMLGEVTPDIVRAILTARAKKILLPVNRAFMEVVGTEGHIVREFHPTGLVGIFFQRCCQTTRVCAG